VLKLKKKALNLKAWPTQARIEFPNSHQAEIWAKSVGLFWPIMYVSPILLPRKAAHIAGLLVGSVMVGTVLTAPHTPHRGTTERDISPSDASETTPIMMRDSVASEARRDELVSWRRRCNNTKHSITILQQLILCLSTTYQNLKDCSYYSSELITAETLCLCVHALKEKWLELSTPHLVHIHSMTGPQHALILRRS